jgi:DNA repair protein RadC
MPPRPNKTPAPNAAVRASQASQASFEDLLFPQEHGAEPEHGAQPADDDSAAPLVRERLAPAPPAAHLPVPVPVFGVKLVRLGSLWLGEPRPRVHGPGDAAAVLWRYLSAADREQFVALLLDSKNGLIGISTISVGDLCSTLVHPHRHSAGVSGEVFKPAILANAASMLLSHNHPSGDPTPSPEDIAVTRRLHEAGAVLGIGVLDHVIVGDRDRWVSLKEKGLI